MVVHCNPDFTHVSKPKLIEVYGDYWHKDDNPQERIDYFKKYGFDTLVLWEYEVWDELTDVVRKVLMFIGRNPQEVIVGVGS